LPIGAERKLDPAALTECDATPDMLNSVRVIVIYIYFLCFI